MENVTDTIYVHWHAVTDETSKYSNTYVYFPYTSTGSIRRKSTKSNEWQPVTTLYHIS